MSKSVTAGIGLLAMALVFSRQLFLFRVVRDQQGLLDTQGGRYHLWLSLLAAFIACIAAALMFYFFERHGSSPSYQPANAPTESAIAVSSEYPTATSASSVPGYAEHWTQLNPWLSVGQDDDRRPMDGSVAESGGTPSGQRTLARESHQRKFKKWSQARSI